MPETKSNQKIIEELKKENEDLAKETKDMRTFFETLTIIKMPLTVKGKAAVILECMVSKDIAAKIKAIIDDNSEPGENMAPKEEEVVASVE